jgi:O-antigen ligase
MIIILILIPLVLVVRPAVYNTIFIRSSSTFDEDTVGGDSYRYRWFLWTRAFTAIIPYTKTTLFGFGMGTHMLLNLESEYVLGARMRTYEFWSWDNDYAVQLLETGFVGLFGFIFLQYFVFIKMVKTYIEVERSKRDIMVVVVSGMLVVLFMMTNVKIFDVKIVCLYWTYVAIGEKIKQLQKDIGETKSLTSVHLEA